MRTSPTRPRTQHSSTTILVGNLPYGTTEADLRPLFAWAGPVAAVTILHYRETGYASGGAMVQMGTADGARLALERRERLRLRSRRLSVSLVSPRAASSPR